MTPIITSTSSDTADLAADDLSCLGAPCSLTAAHCGQRNPTAPSGTVSTAAQPLHSIVAGPACAEEEWACTGSGRDGDLITFFRTSKGAPSVCSFSLKFTGLTRNLGPL